MPEQQYQDHEAQRQALQQNTRAHQRVGAPRVTPAHDADHAQAEHDDYAEHGYEQEDHQY